MINKRTRDELLTSFFVVNQEIRVNACDLQKELQHKDAMERTLIDVTRQVLMLQDKLEQAREEIFSMKINTPYYERFSVTA